MGVVCLDITTSLDGYMAGPNDGPGNGLGDRGGERLHVAPRLLGAGTRLFGELPDAVELETIRVIEAPGVTHLTYRVVKR
ncbi:MAG TPA: hypothetical protein VGM69_03230 [Chloroflexota bacterium]|jgi:hypothetical protein